MVKNYIKRQSGQALLIVVLVMVIALTVGLAVASKSIIGMRMSTEQSESQKALSAAEAGIEQLLSSTGSLPPITSGEIGNKAGYTATTTQVSGSSFNLNGGNNIAKNEGFDVWLSTYSVDPALIYTNPWGGAGKLLTIRWGDSDDACKNAALEIVVLSGTKISPILTRYAVDPCSSRNLQNHFFPIGPSVEAINGKVYYYASSISVSNGLLARIIPLYYSSPIGVEGEVELPSQGSVIESTGSLNKTQRKVTVFRGYPRVPSELFQYSLFTQ
ncbi:MAG: hypothetical protein CO135_03240 [Candidatus Levybacteria bacterium CG_4_9_14_3_um_filter_35_16]|nr:MAG: hypothetical protein COW87_00465 [Candidatus Levybacteria bacterium CG22_combo_CG10-13_8_21_14_all_35_11]PIY94638.1 MAG: hypothetical protein COY68_02045 [Candidatus Levybacteria bacterium CG_4_10_14_0_8_um_filter_35_23]PIZ99794.1 MAG: hypothetical protein COX78_01480 [Candidatus Levybacteria bacterium CG_4_10_14_0_2_um_filter_35_8]PJA91087.1 MAG: hypothetical protein CO135_03240 [Candidatus Levybacteria bacterium CG_4_9_14_3_um_filter_35_16]PJC54663.1 MAG: hypothetical protein CO028_01